MTGIVWFTRDLRLHDHPALRAALDRCERVVCVFCLDDRLLSGRNASGPRQFMLEAWAEVRERLDGNLVIRRGSPERELVDLAGEVDAGEVHFSADSGPFARRRMTRVWHALEAAGVAPWAHPGLHAVDDLTAIRTQADKPYTVFSPFHRSWLEVPRREVLGRPRSLPALPSGVRKGRIPTLDALGMEQEVETRAMVAARDAVALSQPRVRTTPTTTTRWGRQALGASPSCTSAAYAAGDRGETGRGKGPDPFAARSVARL